MLDPTKLDKRVPIPLYFQLKTMLLEEIKSGHYEVDALIPTEKELSEMFQISRTTVRQAISELVQEGWLYRVKSKGTFVARIKLKQDFIKRLETFDEQIARTGCKPSTQLLTFEKVRLSEQVAAHFNIPAGGEYIYLARRRFADADPIVTVETWLPYELCSFILNRDFERESLYNALATRDATRICRVTRVLEAVAAVGKDVEYLNIARGKPIQLSTTVGYNRNDQPIEYSIARYRGDRNRFEVDLLIDTSVGGR